MPEKLSAVLKRKSEIGILLKQAYDAKDVDTLRHMAKNVLPAISKAVQELRIAHRTQWHRMFKPFGWEVIDIRYGGVITRLDTASFRIMEYVEGRTARIEELEQERLVFSTTNRDNHKGVGWCSHYYRMASPNVFYHVLNPFKGSGWLYQLIPITKHNKKPRCRGFCILSLRHRWYALFTLRIRDAALPYTSLAHPG